MSEAAVVLLFVAVLGGAITGAIFERKGRGFGSGFALGFLVPLVGIVIGLAVSPSAESLAARAMESGAGKKCPRCAEVVKRDALVCRFCQFKFDPASAPPAPTVGALERECPNCHAVVFHTAKRCAFCKTPLGVAVKS